MSEDNLEIYFPVPLTSQEAHLLLRVICIHQGIYSGVDFDVEDELRMLKKIKGKLDATVPQSSCDTLTKGYVDRAIKEC